jgi:hypothetical protein
MLENTCIMQDDCESEKDCKTIKAMVEEAIKPFFEKTKKNNILTFKEIFLVVQEKFELSKIPVCSEFETLVSDSINKKIKIIEKDSSSKKEKERKEGITVEKVFIDLKNFKVELLSDGHQKWFSLKTNDSPQRSCIELEKINLDWLEGELPNVKINNPIFVNAEQWYCVTFETEVLDGMNESKKDECCFRLKSGKKLKIMSNNSAVMVDVEGKSKKIDFKKCEQLAREDGILCDGGIGIQRFTLEKTNEKKVQKFVTKRQKAWEEFLKGYKENYYTGGDRSISG